MEDLEETRAEYLRVQNELSDKIITEDCFETASVRTAAGVDLAYWTEAGGEEYAVCCAVVIDFRTREVLEKKHLSGKVSVPYMPGFLAFRELPLVLGTSELLETEPDIYLFDGNGILHPRRMGIASHASFFLKKPTIGVAKTYFRADGKTDYTEPENRPGAFTDIVIGGEIRGRALRTRRDVRPVFVSPGNYISVKTAADIALALTGEESRVPIPTRLADLETHIQRKMINKK